MNVLDLFSGIGGFSLGLERAGFRTVAFCEIDPYCRAVLRKHWPDVPIFNDVRTLTAEALAVAIGKRCEGDDRVSSTQGGKAGNESCGNIGAKSSVDLICGGFPCQDISVAGKGAGIEGERSGLWKEYARIIGEVRPRYAIIENVSAMLGRGLQRVLWDLWQIGYDCEWHCIPASRIGAPHRRDRLWIVAYAHDSEGSRQQRNGGKILSEQKPIRSGGSGQSGDVANTDKPRLERWLRESLQECSSEWATWQNGSHAKNDPENCIRTGWNDAPWQWRTEPNVGRVAHGVPARVDRLRALGNAVVPQIPEIIGRAILTNMLD